MFLAFTATLALASTLVHPLDNRAPQPARPLFGGAEPTPEVMRIFQRACRNCHSDETVWPWYSKVAPVSWMIENDVRQARSKMNLSHWEQYSAAEREAFLAMIGIAVQTKEMPLPRYTLLHPEARLSSDEIAVIRTWTRMERHRLHGTLP